MSWLRGCVCGCVCVDTVFEYCAFLAPYKPQLEEIVKKFSDYKSKVPVCGAIILNKPMDKVTRDRGVTLWWFG